MRTLWVLKLWMMMESIDSLGLFTTGMYLKTREQLIRRQQEEDVRAFHSGREWDGILAVACKWAPGDSARKRR